MASIDINKLIQESMTSTMDSEVVQEGTTEVVADDINSKLADALHESRVVTMSDVAKRVNQDGDKFAPSVARSKANLAKNTGKGHATMADAMPAENDKVEGKLDKAKRYVKSAASGAKDAWDDSSTGKKVAAGGAAAAGLIGAGYMAKKAMSKKK